MAEKFDPKHADKLENPERLVELPPANLVRLLDLTGAETVVDFGAGTGMYSLPIADALPDGLLIALDAQGELLDRLEAKLAAHAPAGRVEVVLSENGRAQVLTISMGNRSGDRNQPHQVPAGFAMCAM